MDENSISVDQLEQIFLDTLNPQAVNEASSIIVELLHDPQFIQMILSLSNFTKHENVLFQCSIQLYHSLKEHWEILPEDFQQNIFDQLLDLIGVSSNYTYFAKCIGIIVSNSSQFQPQITEYILNNINSPNFIQLIDDNSNQFLSFFGLLLNVYSECQMIQQIDFSPMLIHIMENPTSFSSQILSFCIKFLENVAFLSEIIENFDKYEICYHLFSTLPYQEVFNVYWPSFYDFVEKNVLNQEDINQLFQRAYEIVCDSDEEANQKILILTILSSYLNHFPEDFNLNLFEISFQTCTELLYENDTFPIEYLELFEHFFEIIKSNENEEGEEEEEGNTNSEFVSSLYLFIKDQILSNQSEALIITSSITIMSLFLTNSPDSIINDYEFFISFLIECIDSDVPIIQEMTLYLLENSYLIKSEELLNFFSKSVPSLIQKVVGFISSPDISYDLRFKSINSLFSLYAIEHSINENHYSPFFEGIFDQIYQSQEFFSKENFDQIVSCQAVSIFLDPTITDEQLISSYQFAQEILTSNDNDYLISSCFLLLESIFESNLKLKKEIEFDFLFTIQVIQSILEEKVESIYLVKSSLQFLKHTILIYKTDAIEFESSCIELLIQFLNTTEVTTFIIKSIKIIAFASKYSSNIDAANFIITKIFELLERERFLVGLSAFKISSKLIKLLDSENLNRLFSISMSFVYENQDDNEIIKESLFIINKIVKLYLKISKGEKTLALNSINFPVIEIVLKLIKDFIEKKLSFQIQKDSLKCYFEFISDFSELISTIWNFETDENVLFFDFLINYIQYCLTYFEENNCQNMNLYFESVIGCLSDAIQLNVISDQSLLTKLVELTPNLASLASSSSSYFYMKQNICYLLNQLLKVDLNIVVPFIDEFLSVWFHECLEMIENEIEIEKSSTLFENISFLFFEIYGKTKPVFPSSQANQLLIVSIENFPPSIENCFGLTKSLLNSILSNFFSNFDMHDFESLLNNDDSNLDLIKIYSSFVISFIKLLNLEQDELFDERNIDDQDIETLKKIIVFIINKNKEIQGIVSQIVPDEILENITNETE